MCGVDVPVDAAGRCPLGHFVGLPAGAPEPLLVAATTWRAEPEPGAVFTEPTIADPTVELPTVDPKAPTAVFAPVAPAPYPEPAPYDDAAFVEPVSVAFSQPSASFADDSPAASDQTSVLPAHDVAPGESEAQHALSELLAFTESFGAGEAEAGGLSALDVDASQLPDHQPYAGVEDTYDALPSPDEEAEETVEARRRAAGLLGGGLLTLLALAGSIAILPPL